MKLIKLLKNIYFIFLIIVYLIQIFNIYLAKIYYQIFNYVITNIKIILQINISEIFISYKTKLVLEEMISKIKNE